MRARSGRELETSKGPNKESGKDEAKIEKKHKPRMRGQAPRTSNMEDPVCPVSGKNERCL